VRKASVADFPALEKVLARAFDDDPMTNWTCLQDAHRAERIVTSMHITLRLALPFDEIYTTQDQSGAAGWIPPGKTDVRPGALPMLLTKGIRVTGARRAISFLILAMILEKHRPKTPHWYLQPLGVEPSLHGKGIGCALVQPILNRCDQDHIPACLATQTEKNVRFYEHRGFKVLERLKLPFGAPDTWIMWREPR